MRFALVTSAALLVACASSKPVESPLVEVQATGVPGSASASTVRRLTATVEAVDTASRKLTLKGADGSTETIAVPPEVKRLDEIAAGDTVQVELREGLLLESQPPGSNFVTPAVAVAGGRTDKGDAPGAAAAAAVQSTVTITAIDLDNRIVQFQGPEGNKYKVKAGPKISIEKLVVGDRLLATYVTTLAVAIEKKP
jgi:Cu/Ag efflux protein CusF